MSKTLNKKGIKKANEDHLNFIRSSDCSSNSSLIDSEHDDNKIEGTLYYMSPELFTGDYPVGKPIDYWAIGIIIFELQCIRNFFLKISNQLFMIINKFFLKFKKYCYIF